MAADDQIRIRGAAEHNLRGIDVDIPKNKLTVFTGVSGSGKSSLVFDTVAAESQRQLNETFTTFVRNRLPRYGQPDVESMENLSAAIVVDQKRLGGNARSTVGTITDIYSLLRLLFSRAGTPHIGASNLFSFNDPQGMCAACSGIGTVRSIDVDALVDRRLSLNQGAIRFPTFQVGGWMWNTFAESGLFDLDKPLAEYTTREWYTFLHGAGTTVYLSSQGGAVPHKMEGLLERFERIWLPKDPTSLKGRTREAFERVVTQGKCPQCRGARLNQTVLSSLINGRDIAECAALQADDLLGLVADVRVRGSEPVVTALLAHLRRLNAIGLGYLTLDRPSATLSGGESQRVKMVRHLGSSLTGMTYVFDEPSIGLHPHDVASLTGLLRELRDKGNTVLVVEHDPDVIEVADHVIELGPGAGTDGGEVVYQGDVRGMRAAATLTGRHLRHRVEPNPEPRRGNGFIEIRGADQHNLRDIDVDIPIGVCTAVTGVAGSGKSTLMHGYLAAVHADVTLVEATAVHVSRRSSPATYTGILDQIRKVFAKRNGVPAALFTPNGQGACPQCDGLGVIYTDLAFMDPMVSMCEECGGYRFTEEVSQYTYRGSSIGEVLRQSARQALEVFEDPPIRAVLERLVEVGLGYLPLGQPLNTLSGGERQRLKLADELRQPAACYVFDEPTTGLHASDVAGLVGLLNRLVAAGSTVVVIEHNLDVVSSADWVIDLGPGAGRHGGQVVFQGTPRDLLRHDGSRTATHLRRVVAR